MEASQIANPQVVDVLADLQEAVEEAEFAVNLIVHRRGNYVVVMVEMGVEDIWWVALNVKEDLAVALVEGSPRLSGAWQPR